MSLIFDGENLVHLADTEDPPHARTRRFDYQPSAGIAQSVEGADQDVETGRAHECDPRHVDYHISVVGRDGIGQQLPDRLGAGEVNFALQPDDVARPARLSVHRRIQPPSGPAGAAWTLKPPGGEMYRLATQANGPGRWPPGLADAKSRAGEVDQADRQPTFPVVASQ